MDRAPLRFRATARKEAVLDSKSRDLHWYVSSPHPQNQLPLFSGDYQSDGSRALDICLAKPKIPC